MTPIPENALPNYDKRTIEDPSAFFRTLFHLRDIKEERAIPAVVKDYDAKTGEVTVLPMAKYTFDTRDGEAEVDRETVKVRALKICQGGYSISLPIFKGDTGWLIAGDRRCGAAIEKNGEIVVRDLTDEELKDKTAKPDDCSILNFENGFFVPFSWELEDAEKNPNGNFVIRNARDKICEKELENEFGVVRDDKGDDVPFIEDLNGKTHSIDGAYHGRYAWSMIEIQRDGMVNAYGQGRKFTVRKEGLYLDDKPLKFDDIVLKDGNGIEIDKTILEDGKIQYVIGNKGVIALEEGDNITIEPVDKNPGVFRVSSSDGGVKLDHSFSWEGVKKADIAASADIAVDSKTIQGSSGITVTEQNRVIIISGSGSQVSGYTTPSGTYDYEVTGLEWNTTKHRILIHKVKKTYENGLLKTRESVTDEYIQFVEETV